MVLVLRGWRNCGEQMRFGTMRGQERLLGKYSLSCNKVFRIKEDIEKT